MPQNGDKVMVTPDRAHCPKGATASMVLYAPGRFLPVEGMELAWSPFLAERLRTGEISVHPVMEPCELAEGEMLEAAPLPRGDHVPNPAIDSESRARIARIAELIDLSPKPVKE